jgi:hypothetical protein
MCFEQSQATMGYEAGGFEVEPWERWRGGNECGTSRETGVTSESGLSYTKDGEQAESRVPRGAGVGFKMDGYEGGR